MSETLKREMIVPRYLTQFSCVGPACPDTCCYGWQVPVEHETYTRLRDLPDRELKPLIKRALHRGEGKSGSQDFGYLSISKDASARCELLSDEGLCRLHAKCGETILPDICANYPRMTKSVAGAYEQFAMPSCPEVARLMIADPAAMALSVETQSVRQRMVLEIEQTGKTAANEEVRAFFLALLGADVLRVWQRLALSLLVAESLEQAMRAVAPDNDEHYAGVARAVLDDWQQRLADGSALDALAGWRRNPPLHLRALAAASRIRSEMHFNRPRYLALIGEALVALGLEGDEAAGDDEAFRRLERARLSDARDAALGRVLLNFAHIHYYPLQTSKGLAHEVRGLCLQFLMLRFWCAGLALARGGELSDADQAELVYLFYRTTVHYQDYLPRCMDAFEGAGLIQAEHWLLLLPD